jgi:CubicO group peptidase (beta-lactamase class C family)
MKQLAFAAATLSFACAAFCAPPAGFEQRVETARRGIGVPGMAIAIVENDKVTFAKGFGTKALGKPDPVDADTIFPTGSTGKAFTVAALGILVDRGTIHWDDKVIDHLPGFQMYDPWVTREMSIRDLLVHRSGLGLGAGDLLFVPRTNLSRAESVRRLRYLKPATSFRSGFAYDNVLYMVAGQLIESVTGQTWEKFTADQVLKPAGMLHSTSDEDARFATVNRAQPHARMNGGMRGAGAQERLNERDELGRNAAPAGGLSVSANDMARWLLIQLDGGSEDGEIIRGLMCELLDHYLGLPRTDWTARFTAEKRRKVAEALTALKAQTAKPAGIGPYLPVARYAGTYADPWYGNIEVAATDGKLRIDFKSTPDMGGTLEHWQYDSFITRFDDKTIEPAYVTFSLNSDGKVDRVTMKAVSPLADFSYDYQDLLFTPVEPKR